MSQSRYSTEPPAQLRVLVVDDDATIRGVVSRILQRAGFGVTVAEDGVAGLEHLLTSDFDAALVDVAMPRLNGTDVLLRAKNAGSQTEIIMMSACAQLDVALKSVKAGAFEFLTKPFASNDTIANAVRNAAEQRRLAQRAQTMEAALQRHQRTTVAIGRSPKMLELMRVIDGVATADSTVLILGESGTGKELVARALHERSRRADRPLVTVNCAAIPKELVESELFGHVRGAFTGAQTTRGGLFEAANGGTILLDEVGDLPVHIQVKLLRTLQSGEIRRVGSDKTTNVDVRILAATNVDLKAAIERGTFRSDFYYRLNVIRIDVPPLRARRDDIPLLAHHFMDRFARASGRRRARLSPAALRALVNYDWPGNVRELEHAIERAVVLATGDELTPEMLAFAEDGRRASAPPSPERDGVARATDARTSIDVTDLLEARYSAAKVEALARFSRAYLADLLQRCASNQSEAARRSGLDRSNFRRLVRTLGLTPRDEDEDED